MSYRNNRVRALVAALAICLVTGGCSGNDVTKVSPEDLSVDIIVPYATTTPAPEKVERVETGPLSIDGDGNVTLNDASWINSGFSAVDTSGSENYYTQLRLGDSGVEVRNLQTRLRELSYYAGEVSGVFDSATEDAVKLFELSYGTMQTGIATARMQTLLFSDNAPVYNSNAYKSTASGNYTTLQYGDTGPAVYALQERFIELGYPLRSASGIYDEETCNVVRMFYVAYGLKENEIAVAALQKELYSESARPFAGKAEQEEQYTLRAGNIGTLVAELQEQLIALGYLQGYASGTFDDATADAVRLLQRTFGWEETGEADGSLQTALKNNEIPALADVESGAVPGGTLRQGSTGEIVSRLQQRLIELGYPGVEVTGTFDDATAHAVSLVQGVAELEQTGTASEALQNYIFSDNVEPYRATEDLRDSNPSSGAADTVFSLGSSGNGVSTLQTRLQSLGYLNGAISGVYDSATENAVRTFQAAIGVDQTGVVSSSLLLYLASNAAPESGITFFDGQPPVFIRLTLGDSGDEVLNLQRRLWELGFLAYESVENSVGTYNTATQVAVTNAELMMGYQEADGVAGVEFQAFLFGRYGDRLTPEE